MSFCITSLHGVIEKVEDLVHAVCKADGNAVMIEPYILPIHHMASSELVVDKLDAFYVCEAVCL
jgi:hypothetical protein